MQFNSHEALCMAWNTMCAQLPIYYHYPHVAHFHYILSIPKLLVNLQSPSSFTDHIRMLMQWHYIITYLSIKITWLIPVTNIPFDHFRRLLCKVHSYLSNVTTLTCSDSECIIKVPLHNYNNSDFWLGTYLAIRTACWWNHVNVHFTVFCWCCMGT